MISKKDLRLASGCFAKRLFVPQVIPSMILVWLNSFPNYDALPVALVECVSSITFCILAIFFTTGFLLGSWSTLLFAGGFF